MTWSISDEENNIATSTTHQFRTLICPSCAHTIKLQDYKSIGIQDLPGLPAGVKFDPSDQEILQHLEGKVMYDTRKMHPFIDEFIPSILGENGICYTHPEKLPGVTKDGQVRHFFHRPSKAYTTGTRKRRKVHNADPDSSFGGGETRWHKTGKTRAISPAGNIKGYKKILVLYTNYGRQLKPEKTNWVMHQYHFGESEEERDGEFVLSKVFYQTQPRQCGSSAKEDAVKSASDYYISYQNVNRGGSTPVIPTLVMNGERSTSLIRLPSGGSKGD
ncbi:hypothetical protein SASPL_114050 [Salvia splendens]|uniref:NAC domain-containing protein n=1 Tax=Salvia splendens TaxID=180675 RepID=A0A8X8Y581_SALSN|nr:NAC domain-containing protein 73-like [Salvia splendens]KAG6423648.1 hypothetical protein SASPL_114050 [Salvia splendens]